MNRAVILMGTNLGDRHTSLAHALQSITENIGAILTTSSVYETEPWGNKDQPHFLNQVLEVNTVLSPHELLQKLLDIEISMGRTRNEKWEKRIIDLDILYYNDEIVNEPGLKIPHPHLHERRFTLMPLAEILPDLVHPLLGIRNRDLLATVHDDGDVRKLSISISDKAAGGQQ